MVEIQNLKDILIALTEEGKDEPGAALGYALALAKIAGAHLTVEATSTRLTLTHAIVSATAAGLVAAENKRVRDLADAVANKARSEAAAAGVTAAIETRHLPRPQLVEAIAAQARLHDLTILDGELNPLDVDRTLIEAVLLRSGRPLIVVPPNWPGPSCQIILVAWDGSASAARAINDALPFLKTAKSVRIVSITGEKDLSGAIPGAGIAQHLKRHGIDASIENVAAVNGDAGEALRRHASECKADLLVMGGFVHTRLHQWILGGVTQSMFKKSSDPLLMAHQ
jgi:nucleotide-binding universal stress UspA family protein